MSIEKEDVLAALEHTDASLRDNILKRTGANTDSQDKADSTPATKDHNATLLADIQAYTNDLETRGVALSRKHAKEFFNFTTADLRKTEDALEDVQTVLQKRYGLKETEFRNLLTQWKVQRYFGTEIKTPEQLVKAYIKKHSIHVHLNNTVQYDPMEVYAKDNGYSPDDLPGWTFQALIEAMDSERSKDLLRMTYPQTTNLRTQFDRMELKAVELGFIKWSKPILESAWMDVCERLKNERKRDVYLGVEYNRLYKEPAVEQWDILLDAITDHENKPLVKAVLQSWIWQVKRKMLGLSVTHHIMPVLFGKQGCGKSTFIELFLSPLGKADDAWSIGDFRQLEDERNTETLMTLPVMFLDEMSYASRADMGNIKQLITRKDVDYRPLYGNLRKKAPMMCSFIGASNSALNTMITDSTGLRRFFEIQTIDRMNRDVVNSMDYEMLWRSVNEQAQNPIMPFLSEREQEQETLRVLSPIEEWIVWLKAGNDTEKVLNTYANPNDEMFDSYKTFEDKHYNRNNWNLSKFKSELQTVKRSTGDLIDTKRRNYGMAYCINHFADDTVVDLDGNAIETAAARLKRLSELAEKKTGNE